MSRRTKTIAALAAIPVLGAGVAMAASSPAVTTGPAKSVGQTSATLYGSVNPQGEGSNYWFQIGLTSSYTANTPIAGTAGFSKPLQIHSTVTQLSPATVYHYRLVASNKSGETFGADRTFTTTGNPLPTPVTGGATVIGTNAAIVYGVVGTRGQATTWEFQYGTGTGYGSQTIPQTVPSSPTPTNVSYTITGLAQGTTFHYRLITVHSGLPATIGPDATFTTFPSPRLDGRFTAGTALKHLGGTAYSVTTGGRVIPPSSLPAGIACNGNVAVALTRARRLLSFRLAPVLPDCTYATAVTVHRAGGKHPAPVKVTVRFHGNHYLAPLPARVRSLTLR